MSRCSYRVAVGGILAFAFAANCQAYSDGTGEPNTPFEISTVADWQEFMEAEEDWDEHFILTVDLDVNGVALLPIGNDVNNFTGIFDGNDHVIRNVDINMPATDHVGLFGYVGESSQIVALGAEGIAVRGKDYVGGLAGYVNGGNISGCYTEGSVDGNSRVGGLAGCFYQGVITRCYSTASITGTGIYVGGLIGRSQDDVTVCYATGEVTGTERVGGLVGQNAADIFYCYSAGLVSGTSYVGGLVGGRTSRFTEAYYCFWDKETSQRTYSSGGEGKTTKEMQDPNTFLAVGWDFTDDDGDPADWFMPEEGHPQLASASWKWVKVPDLGGMSLQDASGAIADAGLPMGTCDWVVSQTVPPGNIVSHYPMAGFKGAQALTGVDMVISKATGFSGGDGSADAPYQIRTAAEWALLADNTAFWRNHFILMADIDFAGATVQPVGGADRGFFGGVINGNGLVISNIRIRVNSPVPSDRYLGLVGHLSGRVRNLGVENISVTGYKHVGGLVGYCQGGNISACYVTGNVRGYELVGGLFGQSTGLTTESASDCYAAVSVSGGRFVGGLAGQSMGMLRRCYSTGAVSGESHVGGLVGSGEVLDYCFWDVNTSGQSTSDGGVGKTTAELKDAGAYPLAWDTTPEDLDPAVWVIPEDDYPRLAWEYWESGTIPDVNGMPFDEAARKVKDAGFFVGVLSGTVSGSVPAGCVVQQSPVAGSNGIHGVTRVDMVISYRSEFSDGSGAEGDPYEIATVCDWILLTDSPEAWSEYFVMTGDIHFNDAEVSAVGSSPESFSGIFNGNGHVVRNVLVNVQDGRYEGLFGLLYLTGQVRNIRAEEIHVKGGDNPNWGVCVGGLVGLNRGSIIDCHVSGWVEYGLSSADNWGVGGLVGYNSGSVTACSASGRVGNGNKVGGLVGDNRGHIICCYADATIWGKTYGSGGLTGDNSGNIVNSYAKGRFTEGVHAGYTGGLVGRNSGSVNNSFWDVDVSGVVGSAGGEGKSTVEMQNPYTFVSAGWDFVGESANGTDDIWAICAGTNYPRLVWQILAADWVCPDGVGFEDFGELGRYWGSSEGTANLDDEEGIGFGDLKILCEQWLEGR